MSAATETVEPFSSPFHFRSVSCLCSRLIQVGRSALLLLVLPCLLTGCPPDAQSLIDAYPTKSVTVVCPWSPGGGTDRCARFWADQLQTAFGKPFIVMNRTGGSGAIGHSAVARARADGHTLGIITVELSTFKQMGVSDLTYRDYDCLLQFNADAAAIVVRQNAPWQNVDELLAAIRQSSATGQKLKFSGTASGGIWDLARVGMLDAAGLDPQIVTWVPSQGAGPAIVQLLGEHVDALVVSVPEVMSQVEAKELRVLAVMDEARHPDLPDIPTLKEEGIDWSAVGWRGFALPRGTPPEIVARLSQQCQQIAESAAFRDFMQTNGFAVVVRGPEEFRQFLEEQETQWAGVISKAGFDAPQ